MFQGVQLNSHDKYFSDIDSIIRDTVIYYKLEVNIDDL